MCGYALCVSETHAFYLNLHSHCANTVGQVSDFTIFGTFVPKPFWYVIGAEMAKLRGYPFKRAFRVYNAIRVYNALNCKLNSKRGYVC